MATSFLRERKSLYNKDVGLPRPNREARTVSGYAAMWTVDQISDRIIRGAFKRTIRERGPHSSRCRIKLGLNHPGMTHNGVVIGVLTELLEDDIGLYYEGKLDRTTQGEDALIRLESGSLDGSSFAYDILDWGKGAGGTDGDRHLKELKVYELGPVDFACNEDTFFLALKSHHFFNSFDPATLMALGQEMKAGRMFSAANLRKIKAAHECLADLLTMAGEIEADLALPEPPPPDDAKALAGTSEGTELLKEIRSLSLLLKGNI